jgi:hypothetical protein
MEKHTMYFTLHLLFPKNNWQVQVIFVTITGHYLLLHLEL